jgi:hypothetical protein
MRTLRPARGFTMTGSILGWVAFVVALLAVAPLPVVAQEARFLAKEDIVLLGLGLTVEPAHQTVPKDIATIVSTFLHAATPPGGLPPFAPDAEVRATLRGPSFATAQELVVAPNSPLQIPPLTVAGLHTVENIRLVSHGEVLLWGTPESVTIDVIERLLVTQVTARPLTAAEIRERGIVFDQSSFQAYNFSAAFAIQDQRVDINFPVVLPSLQGAQDVAASRATIPVITPPALPSLRTVIPDMLTRLQTQIPNLSVVGFSLEVPELKGQELYVPPIPGVVVIPGDIGFLNQFFSVLLMVGNVAPAGSNLVVTDLRAEIVLPPGKDTVVGSADDPLKIARTAEGETPRLQPVTQPGLDGKLGTADDILTLGPGESGNAEYLVEGRREGSHVVEMEITGTLLGLPIGPVTVRGRAAGAVLVRNPTFTLTFTHPEVVTSGEAYTLDVTVTNTSESPANFVSLNLYPRNVSGATIVGEPTREIESILPGDSSTVSFDLISRRTGRVTAATLDSDENVAGRFGLKAAVGELGVPLSPDSLVLPAQAGSLPQDLRNAAIGLLGKAWAVATAPAAALPKDVRRFSKQIVLDRAVEVAEAGLRRSLHEPLSHDAANLAMDFMGSQFTRIAELNPRPGEADFVRDDFVGFDELRRRSARGDVFGRAVASLLRDDLAAQGAAAFHEDLAGMLSYRPAHLSVLIDAGGAALPVTMSLIDASGRRVGGIGPNGKILKEIPYSDDWIFVNNGGVTTGELAIVAVPENGAYTVRLESVPGAATDTPVTVSLVMPDGAGGLRQVVYEGLTGSEIPAGVGAATDPVRFSFERLVEGMPSIGPVVVPSAAQPIVDPSPSVLGVVQQADADVIKCDEDDPGLPVGRVIAVLFSEEVTRESVQDAFAAADITHYAPEANRMAGVALQPGRRIAFLALRDPIGPFIPRQIGIADVADLRGHVMAPSTQPIEMTINHEAGVVSGRVIQADGTPVPFANVRLFYANPCGDGYIGISSKNADADGRYAWDYVTRRTTDRIVAIDPETEEFRDVRFTISRNGQRLNVDIVLLGRGTFQGRTVAENGTPLRNTTIRVTSLTDQSQYGATSDEQGRFTIARIPVGNLFVEAVNTTANAEVTLSEYIPFAGAVTTRDIVLLDVAHTQVTVQHGLVTGHVLRSSGAEPAARVPVIVYYQNNSQPGVGCGPTDECPVAVSETDDAGAFRFENVIAGRLRVATFDQAAQQEGDARIVLAADGTVDVNVLLSGGFGVIRGIVLDPSGHPVSDARVGGGLSLVTTDTNGEFLLPDVPLGKRTIVAVSDRLGSSAQVTVDLVRPGEEVGATIVLDSVGAVAGVVVQSDGVTPAANTSVYLFEPAPDNKINVVGTAITDGLGAYRIANVRLGDYMVSAFRSDFTDGNVARALLRFNGQTLRVDVRFRGGGGRVFGAVFDDDGVTPLKARVGISGEQLVVAGGQVGVEFKHVRNFRIADTDFTTGRFSMNGVWVGPFTLQAVGQFSPDPVTLEGTMPAAGAAVEMNLLLQPTSRILGTVFQPDGVTPVGANVIVSYKSDAFRIICTEDPLGIDDPECDSIPQGIQEEIVITDEHGRFGLPIVNAGAFTLTADDQAAGRFGQAHGTVRAGDTGEVAIRLLGLGEVTVQVLGSDAVTPIPGARIELAQIAYPKRQAVVFADAQGTTVFAGGDALTEGEFVVTATDARNGFAGRASGRVTTDGEHVTVRVFLFNASGTVYGTVLRSDGLTPDPNVEVVISNGSGPLAFAVTDAAGTYRQEQIPLGDVTIDVFSAATARRGFGAGRIDLDRQEVPVNIVEAAIGLVKGVAMEGGTLAPLKGWTATLQQQSPFGRGLPSLQGTTSVDGSFSFPGASQGTFSVAVRKADVNGSASAAGSIVREGQVVEVPLVVNIIRPLFGSVEGVVFNPDGSPAANAQVGVCFPGSIGCPPAANVTVTAGTDGRFAVDQIPLGRLTVFATSQVSRDSGSATTELAFDGDIATVTVVLAGLREVSGTAYFADGRVAPRVEVTLEGQPESGCAGRFCVTFAAADGNFSFVDVPARTFTVTARDPVTNLKGAVGGALNPGERRVVRIVLEPTGRMTGRVLLPNGNPAQGIVADLVIRPGTLDERHLFLETGGDGALAFDAVPMGPFALALQDSIGPGVARRTGTLAGDLALGDIPLDAAPPMVASTAPEASAVRVPQEQVIRIVFSEPVDAATVNADAVILSSPSGVVTALLNLSGGDTVATLTPLSPLRDETRYSLRVRAVKDRIGKVMVADYVMSFTTVDITAPSAVDISPAPDTNGVTLYSPIRVKFSEPIDPTKFAGPPISLFTMGVATEGRLDFAFGNTVAIFTPLRPLIEDAVYRVVVNPAVDLAGNPQPQGLDYTFATTDRTPPVVLGLLAANNGVVIENAVTTVTADVGVSHDVAVVDFYINDRFAFADRAAPFQMAFQAIPDFGEPGQRIVVSALATDTSGNRGLIPAAVEIAVIVDQPPAVTITTPATGISARNGERIVVTVQAVDDLGLTQVGFQAQTGKPQDAATRLVDPASPARTESFAFHVPTDVAPGSSITIAASASDTKGHIVQAVTVSVLVLDAVAPVVAITGATSGATVNPGQQTNVVVSANDLGAVASITFTASGIVNVTQTRTLDPAQASAVTSFALSVPASARPGDMITLDAAAVDRAGNTASAARVLLAVADTIAPTVRLRPESGSLQMVPGRPVNVIAEAEDEIAVSRIELSGTGALTVSDAKAVSPPSGSASVVFTINVPEGLVPGSLLTLQARAVDISGNVGSPATLTLATRSLVDITLPPSAVVVAGETIPVTAQLAEPAPAGGLRVEFVSADPTVAGVTPAVLFAAGEMSRTVDIAGVSGGTVAIQALVQGVERTRMTVTVRGGVVTGTVWDSLLNPVPNAQVTVNGGADIAGVTDAAGQFFVEGVGGPLVSVKALDPTTRRIGFSTGSMNRYRGFARINVVLISAGSIRGTVLQPDGVTLAGPGVQVDLFQASDTYFATPLSTTFTNPNTEYEFPLVTLGSYVLRAGDTGGNRGRTSVTLATSGQEAVAPIAFLGRGTVTGTVLDGSSNPVPNAAVTFQSYSLFGAAPMIAVSAEADGTFRFENVFAGTFTVTARDPVTDRAGSASGSLNANGAIVLQDVRLATYGALQGTVFRADGVTPVAGATVTYNSSPSTFTDEQGRYAFAILPLGSFSLSVRHDGTRGRGTASGRLDVHGQTVIRDVVLLAQGTIIATVTDAGGNEIVGAFVSVEAVAAGGVRDNLSGQTIDDGTSVVALLDHVLAGTFTARASSGGLSGTTTGTLAPDEVKPITIPLEPTATIEGHVFAPDGQTPMTSGTVKIGRLDYWGFVATEEAPLTDGTFRFEGLRLTPVAYHLRAYDAQGLVRALAREPVVLTTAGQIATREMTFVGLGHVNGRVLNPDGSSASALAVQIRDLNADFGGYRNATTDAAGFYEVRDLPVGRLAVSAGDASRGLLGEASGEIAADGQTVTVDVLLQANAVTLPINRYDANNFLADIQPDGMIRSGTASVFVGHDASIIGASRLDLVVGGVANRFTGGTIGTLEGGGREVATRQQGLAGLNVTRKIFGPRTGYFTRYLEILTNPTAAPITLDVRVSHNVRGLPNLLATSSGDAALNVSDPATADRWIMIDDADGDPFIVGGTPSLAFTFDGASAPEHAGAATFTTSQICYPYYGCNYTRHLTYQWSAVTIPAGGTVAYMHFGVQQTSRAAARASAERIVQLPPEALESLSPDEVSEIRNFAVPVDGVSALAALPRLDGTVAGRLIEGDGAMAVPYASVTFKSSHPLFGRTHYLQSDASGQFRVAQVFNDYGGSRMIPVDAFTLGATHPRTQVQALPTVGNFPAGQTVADQDIVFSNTGLVSGRVRRHTGEIVTSGTVQISGGGVNASTAIAGDGGYAITGLPAADITFTASVPHPQGSYLTGTRVISVLAGQSVVGDLTIVPTGAVSGIVQTGGGAPAAGVSVRLDAYGFYRYTQTDTSGRYALSDVPVGAYTVAATEPRTGLQSSAAVAVAQDQTSEQNLALVGVGTLDVTVSFASGSPAGNGLVYLSETARGAYFRYVGRTDPVTGRLTIPNVTTGAFTLRAYHPNTTFSLTTEVTTSLAGDGQTLPITVTLPPTGAITGRVTFADGLAAANTEVDLRENGSYVAYAMTDATGAYTFAAVPLNRTFTIRAYNPSDYTFFRDVPNQMLTSDSQVLTVNVTLPGFATVRVTVLNSDGTPFAGAGIRIYEAFRLYDRSVGSTDAVGVLSIANVPEGAFTIRVRDSNGRLVATAQGAVGPADVGLVVNITVTTGIALPTDLFDANGFRYDIQTNGTLSDGSNDAYDGAYEIGLIVGGGSPGIYGSGVGMPEDNRRELGIELTGSTNLEVTRKVFVPTDGYFARYLEIVRNPGTAPATVDVAVSSNLGSDGSTRIVSTSNGDTTFTTDDRWLVTDDDAGDEPFPNSDPTLAHVIGGTGGAIGPAVVSLASSGRDALSYRWNGLTLQPGETVILMHFAVQQLNQAAAQASAERLAQLPPEALAGLSAEERAAIRNFAVPADGVSALPPLPPHDASVSGRVLGGDALTPAPSATVTFRGTHPIFGGGANVVSNANGEFLFSNVLADAFTLQARHPLTDAMSPTVAGSFASGETSAVQDVVFSDSGVILGTVRRGTTAVTSGTVTALSPSAYLSVPIRPDGGYAITGVPPGAMIVQASSGGATGEVENILVTVGQATTAVVAIGTGSVTGSIVFADGTAASNAYVVLNNPYFFGDFVGTYTNASGAYTIAGVPLGRSFTVRADHPNGLASRRSAGQMITTDGQSLLVDLTLPGFATVRVTLLQPDGATPIPGAYVYIQPDGLWQRYAGVTGADGVLNIPTVSEGGFTVQAYDNIGFAGSVAGVVTTGQIGGILNATIVSSPAGYVSGHVWAADGETPLSVGDGEDGDAPFVELIDVVTGEVIQSRSAYGGAYSFYSVTAEHGFTVRASFGAGLTAQGSGAFAFRGETVTIDLTLPVSVVRGTVTFSDGTPVSYPNVFATQTDAAGVTRTFYAARNAADGSYGIAGIGVGDFRVTAQDSASGLRAEAAATLDASDQILVVNLALPPSATIQGAVFTASGNPVAWAYVALASPGLSFTRQVQADDLGRYRFDQAPLGPFSIQACDYYGASNDVVCGVAGGALEAGGGTVDVTLPALGEVSGSVFGTDGTTPVANADVTLENFVHAGPMDAAFTTSATADASGHYQFTGIPVGALRISAFDPTTNLGGLAEGTLTSAGPTAINVTVGNAARLPFNLDGADGFRYDVDCYGRIGDGGTVNRNLSDAYDGSSYLAVYGSGFYTGFPCTSMARLENGGRELVLGPSTTSGVTVSRKLFVPPGGRFLRNLETVTNSSAADLIVTVEVSGNLGPTASRSRIVVAPSDTGETFAVTNDAYAPDSSIPALAHVFAGSGARAGVSNSYFVTGDDNISYIWTVTIPAGQTRSLMHFAVQRDPDDAAGARTQAEALVSLSDPDALSGMTAEERAAVLNFNVP